MISELKKLFLNFLLDQVEDAQERSIAIFPLRVDLQKDIRFERYAWEEGRTWIIRASADGRRAGCIPKRTVEGAEARVTHYS